jgi:hypothetical protein
VAPQPDRQDPPAGPPRDTVEALGRLGDPQREVAVLRLLCGHSLDHTAQLSGYTRRAVLELQLAACLAISDLTGGAEAGAAAAAAEPWSPPGPAPSADEFERRLGRRETDLAGGDPAPPAACGASPCPAPTTAAAAAGGDSRLGTALTTLAEPPSTSTTGAKAATPPTTTAPTTTTAAPVTT